MRFNTTIRLIITFYKSFVLAAVFITACCWFLFWEYGYPIFAAVCWLKVATMGIIYWYINSYKQAEYYYYLNLGISKRMLWIVILLFDFLLFILLLTQLHKFI